MNFVANKLLECGDLTKGYLSKMVELGYWKDIFELYEYGIKNKFNVSVIFDFIKDKFQDMDSEDYGLFCKYFPRKSSLFNEFAKAANLSYSELRKWLVKHTEVVETKMCAKEWNEIDFEKVPSVAMLKYNGAFKRNAEEKFQSYIDDVNAGKAKMNTSVIGPVDIMEKYLQYEKIYDKNAEIVETMWTQLDTSMFKENNYRILPVPDVSGSMCTKYGSVTPISASVGLSIFLAQNNHPALRNLILSFSKEPFLHDIEEKSIQKIVKELNKYGGLNTDVMKMYDAVLELGKRNPEALPTHLLIFSDMQFDQIDRSWNSDTPFTVIEKKFKEAGLKMPKIIFWNLSITLAFPASINDNVLLISGYDKNIFKDLLKNATFDVMSLVRNTVDKEKYTL